LLSSCKILIGRFFFRHVKPWSERTKPEENTPHQGEHYKQLAGLTEGIAFAFPPPGFQRWGTSGGFQSFWKDRAGKDVAFLAQNLKTFWTARVNRRS